MVVLAGLFVAVLFRREAITSVALFRLGYILFIVSLVAPELIQAWWAAIAPQAPFVGAQSGHGGLYGLLGSLSPVALAISLLCIFGSLLPRTNRWRNMAPAVPPKHPLD